MIRRLSRRWRLWIARRRAPIGARWGLSRCDLIRIARDDLRPLKYIHPSFWSEAITEVPLPKSGYDMNLDANALLAILRQGNYSRRGPTSRGPIRA